MSAITFGKKGEVRLDGEPIGFHFRYRVSTGFQTKAWRHGWRIPVEEGHPARRVAGFVSKNAAIKSLVAAHESTPPSTSKESPNV